VKDKMLKNLLVVTRHKDLVALLKKWGDIDESVRVIEHTDNVEDVRNMDVIGVVPAKLAIFANSVTEVPLTIPQEWRGKEIPLDKLETMASVPITYKIEKIETRTDFSEAVLYSRATTFIQYVIREGLIQRDGQQHKSFSQRNGAYINRSEIEGKPVIGHLPYHLGQYALDITTYALYYEFERRGLVHSYEEMKQYNPDLFTYKVRRLS